MLSKRQLKLIRSLALKKHRDETRLFVAEGAKVVGDLMPHFDCAFLGMTADFARRHPGFEGDETAELTQAELCRKANCAWRSTPCKIPATSGLSSA